MCLIWVEVEHKYQVSTFKHNHLQIKESKSV